MYCCSLKAMQMDVQGGRLEMFCRSSSNYFINMCNKLFGLLKFLFVDAFIMIMTMDHVMKGLRKEPFVISLQGDE